MSLLDGALCRSAILELSAHRCVLPLYPSLPHRNSFCCNAKISVDDGEEKHESNHKGFSIRVPTIPKLGDIESARRMLESAFQALSFEMPRIPIDSALQGLNFDIFKLTIPKQGIVFDITGFVATKLWKPPKHQERVAVPDEAFYPRCAWPRTLKEGGLVGTETSENLQNQESGVNLVLEESTSAYPQLQTVHLSPKADLSSTVELGERLSIPCSSTGKGSFKDPVGPHCAWPRKTHRFVNADGALSAQSISSNVLYPRSAWPRNSLSRKGVVLDNQQSIVEFNMGSVAKEEEVSPSIIEGGPRCAWPRKSLSAKQSCHADETTTTVSEDLHADGPTRQKDAENGKSASANFDGAAELPRRMLATSVGLSVMNQLAKSSIVTSLFDFCSLLPAGNLEFAEEEAAALDSGRRTLLVFFKHSSG